MSDPTKNNVNDKDVHSLQMRVCDVYHLTGKLYYFAQLYTDEKGSVEEESERTKRGK